MSDDARLPRHLRIVSLLRGLVALAAAAHVALFAGTALARLGHPFELEWLEGAMFDHVARVRAGLPLYTPPSIDHVPFVYGPLYPLVAAGLGGLVGHGFMALRLVSLGATLGTAGLLFWLIQRRTRNRVAGLVAAGLFCGSYAVTGAWLDLGRVDALLLLCFAGALGALDGAGGRILPVAVAIPLFLAVLAKQTALVMALPLLGHLAWTERRRGVATLALFGALVLGSAWLGHRATGGWSTYYLVTLPAAHELRFGMLGGFVLHDLVRVAPVSLIVLGVALARRGSDAARGERHPHPRWFTPGVVGLAGGALLMRLHQGGWDNALLPLHVAFALAAGLLYGRREPAAVPEGRRAAQLPAELLPMAALRAALLPAVLLGQLALLGYRPSALVPTEADAAAGRSLVARLAAASGPVFVPSHGGLAVAAGKPATAHGMAIRDVLRGRHAGVVGPLREELAAALRARRFAAIVLDGDPQDPWHDLGLLEHYRVIGPALDQRFAGAMRPPSGWPTRPALWLEPRTP